MAIAKDVRERWNRAATDWSSDVKAFHSCGRSCGGQAKEEKLRAEWMAGGGEGGLTVWKSGATMAFGSVISWRGLRSRSFESGVDAKDGGARCLLSGPRVASG